MEQEYLFRKDMYAVMVMSKEDRGTEAFDNNGNPSLLESPLNYAIINIETGCTEARSPFYPAAMKIAEDLAVKTKAVLEELFPKAKAKIELIN